MSGRGWLRAASVFTAIFAAGHSFGHFHGLEPKQLAPVIAAMRTVRFDAGGSSRTIWDLFEGYSLLIIVTAAFLAVLLWLVSRLDARTARPFAIAIAATQIAFAILCSTNFFWAPAVLNALSAGCSLVAALSRRTVAAAGAAGYSRG